MISTKFKMMFTAITLSAGISTGAYATSFTMDTSSLGIETNATTGATTGGERIENIDYLDVVGNSIVMQLMSNFPNLSVGDTFTESGLLKVADYKNANGVITNQDLNNSGYPGMVPDGYELFVDIQDVSGVVTSLNTAEMQYDFDAGQAGSIKFYFDTTVDNVLTAGSMVELASFSILDGGGDFEFTSNGGFGSQGNTNFTLQFDSVLSGVFFDEDGNDFSDIIANAAANGADNPVWALSNTTNRNIGETPMYDANGAPIGVELTVTTNGTVGVQIPEPGSLALLGLGLLGFGVARKRNQ